MLTVVFRWNKAGFRWMALDIETRSHEIVDMPACARFKRWIRKCKLRKDCDNIVILPGPILKRYDEQLV